MKIRVFIIFGVCYSLLLAALAAADNIFSELLDWDPAEDGLDNLLGLLFFVVAILLSVNRHVHMALGGASDPADFRNVLFESRWSLIIGIVFITTLANLVVALMPFPSMTGEMVWPSPLRASLLCAVYGVLARVIIVESVERMRYA